MPIYVSDDNTFYPSISSRRYHILSREAESNKKLFTIRKIALSVIKKYPQIIGIIKRLRPNGVTFCAGSASFGRGTTVNSMREIIVPIANASDISQKEAYRYLTSIKDFIPEEVNEYIDTELEDYYIFPEQPLPERRRRTKKSMGWTTLHELKHIEQIDKEESPDRFTHNYQQTLRKARVDNWENLKQGALESHFNPYETEAQQFAYQETKKIDKKKKKNVNKLFGTWIGEYD